MTFLGIASRSLLRNKTRTGLTVLGVAIAVLAFLSLRTAIFAFTGAANAAPKDRIVTRHKVTFIMSLPFRYFNELKALPGIQKASYASWFGGKEPAHPSDFFASFAVDHNTYADVYDDMLIPKEQLERFQQQRDGVIVGDALASKYGWKIGDKVRLESGIYPTTDGEPWTFQIAGIYTATSRALDRSSFLLRWDYLNDGVPPRMRDSIGWMVSRVEKGASGAEAARVIDRHFDTRDVQTLSQDERAFNASFLAGMAAILDALGLVSVIILGIMALILGNTIAMGVRERTSEYGTLRAIGFLPKHVIAFILGEGLVTGLFGGLFGLVLAETLINVVAGPWLEQNLGAFLPFFRLDPVDAAIAIVLAGVLSLAASAVPAYRASRLDIIAALRRVA